MAMEVPLFSKDEHRYAQDAVAKFIRALHRSTAVIEFEDPCLGIGADTLCLMNEAMLPRHVVGKVKVDFIPALSPRKFAEAIIDMGVDPLIAIGCAFLHARVITLSPEAKLHRRWFDIHLDVVESGLRALYPKRR